MTPDELRALIAAAKILDRSDYDSYRVLSGKIRALVTMEGGDAVKLWREADA